MKHKKLFRIFLFYLLMSFCPCNLFAQIANNTTLNVFMHIIRKNNGGGNDQVSFTEAINAYIAMRNNLIIHGICINLKGIDFINKTDFYFFKESKDYNDIVSTNVNSDAIDIYLYIFQLNDRIEKLEKENLELKKDIRK